MWLFYLKDLKLKTKKHHAEAIAFRSGVALLANENARIQEKCSICEGLKGSRECCSESSPWASWADFLKHIRVGRELSRLWCTFNAQIILFPHPHKVLEFAAPCRGVRHPWGTECFTPCHCLNRSWARGGAPPEGDVSKLMLGKLLLWSSRTSLHCLSGHP